MLALMKEKEKKEREDNVKCEHFSVQREDLVNVYIRVNIVRIGHIDFVRQGFQCKLSIMLRWRE